MASRLATAKVRADSDLRRFDELYVGELIGIEQYQGEVENAMVRFRHKRYGEPIESDKPILQLALDLATATGPESRASQDSLLAQHKEITSLVSATVRK